jgi:hypothetical protein
LGIVTQEGSITSSVLKLTVNGAFHEDGLAKILADILGILTFEIKFLRFFAKPVIAESESDFFFTISIEINKSLAKLLLNIKSLLSGKVFIDKVIYFSRAFKLSESISQFNL